MNYCDIGPDSDVRLFGNGVGYTFILNYFGGRQDVQKVLTIEQAIVKLMDCRKMGIKFPATALMRLAAEHKELLAEARVE